MEKCSDALLDHRALCLGQAEKDGIDLNVYRQRILNEMEEKKKAKNRLKLSRSLPGATATATATEKRGSQNYSNFIKFFNIESILTYLEY